MIIYNSLYHCLNSLCRVGYHECLTETMHFLVEKEGLYAGDPTCVRLINHLQKHYDQLSKNNGNHSIRTFLFPFEVSIIWYFNLFWWTFEVTLEELLVKQFSLFWQLRSIWVGSNYLKILGDKFIVSSICMSSIFTLFS